MQSFFPVSLQAKDSTVREVAARLREHFGDPAFAVVDHWEADLCAIGVTRSDDPGRLVHVCTFGRLPGRYDVELESPAPAPGNAWPYASEGWYHDVSFAELAALAGRHLGLERSPGASRAAV